MRYEEIRPSARLRAMVRCYWFLSGEAPGPETAADPALPDGSPELIFNLGDPVGASVASGRWTRQPRAMLVGQITGPLAVRPTGRVRMAAVRFEPFGASHLYRPMAALTDGWIGLDAIPWCGGARLRSALEAAADQTRQRSLLEAWLIGVMSHDRTPDPRVVEAVRIIRASHGATPIERLSASLRLSSRRLQRLFAIDVGVTPKLLARITRFHRVFSAWQRDPRSLARVAAECGYFDQPHLIRDFRDFAGAAPAAFLASQPEFTAFFTSSPV